MIIYKIRKREKTIYGKFFESIIKEGIIYNNIVRREHNIDIKFSNFQYLKEIKNIENYMGIQVFNLIKNINHPNILKMYYFDTQCYFTEYLNLKMLYYHYRILMGTFFIHKIAYPNLNNISDSETINYDKEQCYEYNNENYVNIPKFIKQIKSSIEFLHNLDILHCDICPANIIISNNNIKIMDFESAINLCNKNIDYTIENYQIEIICNELEKLYKYMN